MTLPENSLKYDICSLHELRKFVTERKIPFKYTHAQSHTKKSQTKREKDERRKLVTALYRGDATATIRFLDLPPELRDEVYYHFFLNQKTCYHFVMNGKLTMEGSDGQCLQRVPEQIRDEMNAVFNAVLQQREGLEKSVSAAS